MFYNLAWWESTLGAKKYIFQTQTHFLSLMCFILAQTLQLKDDSLQGFCGRIDPRLQCLNGVLVVLRILSQTKQLPHDFKQRFKHFISPAEVELAGSASAPASHLFSPLKFLFEPDHVASGHESAQPLQAVAVSFVGSGWLRP